MLMPIWDRIREATDEIDNYCFQKRLRPGGETRMHIQVILQRYFDVPPTTDSACPICQGNDKYCKICGVDTRFTTPAARRRHMVYLMPSEMEKAIALWNFHKTDCSHKGCVKIEQRSGGGIGTVTVVICGCGKELDATDYGCW